MATTDVMTFDLSVEIRRPPAAVFALLADIQDFEPIPRDAVVKLVKEPSGPTAVGTLWHEKVKLAPCIWLHVENLVSEVDAPHRLTIDAHNSWMTAHLTYQNEPVAGGSVQRQHETLRLWAPPRWLGPYVERGLRPRLHQRLSDIKTILEQPPG